MLDNRSIFEVGVFVIVPRGTTMLFVRDGSKDSFSLPGGAPREDIHPATENILATGVRETEEEGCVIVTPRRLVGLFSYQRNLGFLYLLEGALVQELPFKPLYETVEREWVRFSDVLDKNWNGIKIFPAQRAMARQYIKNLPGNFPLFGSYQNPASIFQYNQVELGKIRGT